jgi:hypothetical protein
LEVGVINYTELQISVVHGLSALLAATRTRYELERHFPQKDADGMDDAIAAGRDRIEVLKRLRDEFEAEMAKPAP